MMSGKVEADSGSREFGSPSAQESRHDSSSSNFPTASGWQIAGASVRGAIHRRDDALNQDAFRWWSAEGENPVAVLCVADGHGGSEYTHSDEGARLAVEQAQMLLVSEVLPRIRDGRAQKDLTQFKNQLEHRLPKDLHKRWRASVYEHATDHPISRNPSSDSSAGKSKEEPEPPLEQRYGTTLLAALLTPVLHLYIQLGDGDILTVSSEGEVTRPPFEHDNHLIANYSTSLCSKEAWRFVRIHFQPIEEKPPVLVMLATDGYANSFSDRAAFEQVAIDVYEIIQRKGVAAVGKMLPGWLKDTSEAGSGDDICVVVATTEGRLERK